MVSVILPGLVSLLVTYLNCGFLCWVWDLLAGMVELGIISVACLLYCLGYWLTELILH
jgi:hypothetical protein